MQTAGRAGTLSNSPTTSATIGNGARDLSPKRGGPPTLAGAEPWPHAPCPILPGRLPRSPPMRGQENASMIVRLSRPVMTALAVGFLTGPGRLLGDEPAKPTPSATEAKAAIPAPGHSVHG